MGLGLKANLKACCLILPMFWCASVSAQQEVLKDIRQDFREQLDEPPMHTWERFVRKFRRDHHLALIGLATRGEWQLNHVGTENGVTYQSKGMSYRIQYSFHLQIIKKFGYFLGSEFGYNVDQSKQTGSYRAADSMTIPGLLSGLVFNFSPPHRILVSFGVYMERFDHIHYETPGTLTDQDISISMTTTEWSIAYDYFMSLSWAVRADYHRRFSNYDRPKGWEGKAVDVSLKRSDYGLGLGLVHHFI